jgi:hypothetical protein
MFGQKKIKICKKCSGLDVNELKRRLDPKDCNFCRIKNCNVIAGYICVQVYNK